MNKLINYLKKYSLEITLVSIAIAIFTTLMLINRLLAFAYLGFWISVYVLVCKQEETQKSNRTFQLSEIYTVYVNTASVLYTLLNEYAFLGLHIPSENSLCYPNDYFRIYKQTFPIFRYKLTVTDSFRTEPEELRKILNERIEQELFYQPIYILRILKERNNLLSVVIVIDDCPVTHEYIQEKQRAMLKKQNVHVNTNVEDF